MKKILLTAIATAAMLTATTGAEEKAPAKISLAPASRPANAVVARVNGAEITEADIAQAFKLQRVHPQMQERFRDEVIQRLISDKVFRQFMSKTIPEPSQAEINLFFEKQFKAIQANFKTRGVEITRQNIYEKINMSREKVNKEIVLALRMEKWADKNASNKEIADYYSKHSKDYEKIRISHILLKTEPNAGDAAKKKVRASIDKIRAKIIAGGDFAKLAEENSACSSSRTGGDLGGYYDRNAPLARAFIQAAFKLKTGEISPIVETKFGLHIIKVTDRKSPKPEEVNKRIRAKLSGQKLNEAINKEIAKAKIERL